MVKLEELISVLLVYLILQISANQDGQENFSNVGTNKYLTTTPEPDKKNDTTPRPTPIFPNTYIAEGIISVPYTSIKQPIQVWFNGEEGVHRIDYYNGAIATLRMQKKNEILISDFFPVTTRQFKNKFHCKVTKEEKSRLDVFLPLLSNHRYCGEEIIQGVKTEKWCNKTNTQNETVYVQFKNSENESQGLIPVPVMIIRDANCYGQHIHFTKFSDSKPDTKFMTEFRKGLKCMNATEFEVFILGMSNDTIVFGEHKIKLDLLPEDYVNLPETFDWRDFGAVSEVKNQGEDGPCWTFATTAMIESAYLIRSNGTQKFDLSEQALLDCCWEFGVAGHFGGDHMSAFRWIIKNGGIPTETEYGPYLAKSGYCHADKVNLTASISGYGLITEKNQTIIKAALKHYGPMAMAMDAYRDSFKNYKKSDGIYNDPTCKTGPDEMNHVVLLVGYGKQNNTEYWIVKNSWGTQWGHQGYAYIAIENNVCGLMTFPTYLVI